MLRVVDIMSRNVVTVARDTPVHQAASLMNGERVGSVLVIHNDMPVGIVTETDFTRVVAEGLSGDSPVSDIMSAPLYYSHPDADIIEVANAMTTNEIKKIPVLEGPRVLGMVTQTDIIKHIFRTVRSLELQYKQGAMDSSEFAQRFSSFFHDFDTTVEGVTRNWYMRCRACGHTFMNPETDGRYTISACPKCSGDDLAFDPHPKV